MVSALTSNQKVASSNPQADKVQTSTQITSTTSHQCHSILEYRTQRSLLTYDCANAHTFRHFYTFCTTTVQTNYTPLSLFHSSRPATVEASDSHGAVSEVGTVTSTLRSQSLSSPTRPHCLQTCCYDWDNFNRHSDRTKTGPRPHWD